MLHFRHIFFSLFLAALLSAQTWNDISTPVPLKPREILIVGFLGGREPWNNSRRSVRKLAVRLRDRRLPAVHVETFENTKRKLALELVAKAFDRDSSGHLDEIERTGVKLIVYGQSFGGAAVVKFARQLDSIGVPILLTVQVDSVGSGDSIIPPNVATAANLYQRNGWPIRGQPEILAADPSRTRILANLRFDYRNKVIDVSEASWFQRLTQTAHTKMDHDPEVWSKVESFILAAVDRVQMSN